MESLRAGRQWGFISGRERTSYRVSAFCIAGISSARGCKALLSAGIVVVVCSSAVERWQVSAAGSGLFVVVLQYRREVASLRVSDDVFSVERWLVCSRLVVGRSLFVSVERWLVSAAGSGDAAAGFCLLRSAADVSFALVCLGFASGAADL